MKGVLWIALCGLIIGLATNAVGAPVSHSSSHVNPQHKDDITFGNFFNRRVAEIKSILSSLKQLVISAETEITSVIVPLARFTINRTADNVESTTAEVLKDIEDIINKINDIELTGELKLKADAVTASCPEKVRAEIKLIIERKILKVLSTIIKSNFTHNEDLKIELLKALNDSEKKRDTDLTIKITLSRIIYEKYLEISDKLKTELIKKVNKIVKYLGNYIKEMKYKKEGAGKIHEAIGNGIAAVEEFAIDKGIDLEIDKRFKDENERNKKKIDDVVNNLLTPHQKYTDNHEEKKTVA